MNNALTWALGIVSVLIILFVTMQPSKSNVASSLTGGDDGAPKIKARGFEAFLIKVTRVLGILFFVLAIVIAVFSAK